MNSEGPCAVTGASGYVGSIITQALRQHVPVVGMVRNPASATDIAWTLESSQDIGDTLRARGVKTLVHAAWDMHGTNLEQMQRICVRGSAALFDAARRAGVERIVFISTISAFEGCRSVYGRTKLEVEKMLADDARVVFRPGHVFGARTGGVFGSIQRQVRTSRLLPMIGGGRAPQYLLHEKTLSECILRAVSGDFDHTRGAPITLANPTPWRFRDLVQSVAASEGRKVTLVPVPWPLLFGGIRAGEALRLKLPFRSDSIISFVYHDRKPDFRLLDVLGIKTMPYAPS